MIILTSPTYHSLQLLNPAREVRDPERGRHVARDLVLQPRLGDHPAQQLHGDLAVVVGLPLLAAADLLQEGDSIDILSLE